MSTALSGFFLSISLIMAIGSQNAFVLKQGIKKQYVFIVCSVCAISDIILIGFGVAGFGAIINQYPQIEIFARYGGAAFLLLYSAYSFHASFTQYHAISSNAASTHSAAKAALICMAFTWLNPHVYLDTVVLLGSISTQYQPNQLTFGLGAATASLVFFYSLGYGARYLGPLFKNPKAWKILDFCVGVMMLVLAVGLLLP